MEETVIAAALAPVEPGEKKAGRKGTNGATHKPDNTKADKKKAASADLDEYDAFDEYDDLDEYDDADPSSDSDEIQAIDATLARFGAVHDEIAVEEAARRKKYSWLFGMRREPELGRDIPFDFIEGRDAQSSRLEWKKEQRKRRTTRILQVVGAAAVLMICVVAGISLIA